MPPRLIGPRRESGAFYKKRPAVRKPRPAAALSKVQKKAVTQLIVNKAQTKYCVSDISGLIVEELPVTFTTPVGWKYVMPKIARGDDTNQRIGDRISNVRGKTTMHFYLSNLALGLTQDVFVKIFYGCPRSVTNFNQFGDLQKNTLLEIGDATTTDWNTDVLPVTTAYQLATMPVSKTNWILRTKVIRLTQNAGALNGDGGTHAPHATQPSHRQFVWNWSHRGPLKYPTVGAISDIPTNYCPVFIAVPYFVNQQIEAAPVVTMQWRNEVYYKDV